MIISCKSAQLAPATVENPTTLLRLTMQLNIHFSIYFIISALSADNL